MENIFSLVTYLNKGYVSGDVLPMIQKIERFTENATTAEMKTITWNKDDNCVITKMFGIVLHSATQSITG